MDKSIERLENDLRNLNAKILRTEAKLRIMRREQAHLELIINGIKDVENDK